MTIVYTVNDLADIALDSNKEFTAHHFVEAWTNHMRENARIINNQLIYLGLQIDLDKIENPENIGEIIKRQGGILIESTLAYHLETAIPHLAGYMIDEYLEKSAFLLESTKKYENRLRFPPILTKNNKFLNKVNLLNKGPLIYGQIDYSENVIWLGDYLWLLQTQIAEVIQQNLLSNEKIGSIFDHPFFKADSKIKDIKSAGDSVQVLVEINVQTMSSLRIYRTGLDGHLMSPIESAGI